MPLIRVRDGRVEPVELWDTRVDGASLFAWQSRRAELPRAVAAAVRALCGGTATFESPKRLPRPRPGSFSRCYLSGAGAELEPVSRALEAEGFPCRVALEPAFPGVLGAARLAGDDALGIDVGQTGVKAWHGQRRARIPRDWASMPLFDPAPPLATMLECQERLIRMMVAATGELAPVVPAAVVIALPAHIAEDGALGGCTYAFPPENRELVPSFLARAGLADREVLLLNDAELAGHSALADSEGAELVLTFGFGIGGAVVLPTRSPGGMPRASMP